MSAVEDLIAKATAGTSPVQLDYSDVLPNAEAIASACGAEEVHQLLRLIERTAQDRDDADRSGTVNGDDLDFMWNRLARYASLLPHLVSRHLPIVVSGLKSHRSELRLYVAEALKVAPSADAVADLEACLVSEEVKPVRSSLEQALANCKGKGSWLGRFRR